MQFTFQRCNLAHGPFGSKFGGGGHPAAAGFNIESKDMDVDAKFKSALAEHVRNILRK
jgi:nanoRNase/pAp phosphatase (c-di-AMP/oligoRNAs hydrolase)